MQSVYGFVITPSGGRYKNTSKVGDKELIINSEIYNHQFTNREATVVEVPKINSTGINKGDTVIVHHNVFRRVKTILTTTHTLYTKIKYFYIKILNGTLCLAFAL